MVQQTRHIQFLTLLQHQTVIPIFLSNFTSGGIIDHSRKNNIDHEYAARIRTQQKSLVLAVFIWIMQML